MKNAEISAVGEVVVLQTDIVWQDREANLGVVGAMLEEAMPARGALVVLPEMALSGFSMDPERSADDGSGVRALGDLARRRRLGRIVLWWWRTGRRGGRIIGRCC